jgi:hypothetical protein
MSIGYRIPAGGAERDGQKRLIKQIDLVEISIVESPADLSAQIGDVKSAIDEAESLKEIESLLRDAAGFSRADATALVARIKSMCHGERDTQDQTAAIAGLFQQFNNPQS